MELINILGIALLALLVRKLIWCFLWLWCYYRGRKTPEPIPFLPRRWDEACQPFSGDVDFLPAGGHGPSATIWLVQERPLPFHLLALSLDVEFAEI